MPAIRPHPRAALNAGGKPPEKPAHTPQRRALEAPADTKPTASPKPQGGPPSGPPQADRRLPASTKLEPDEMAKLNRIRRKLGRTEATISATLRFLVRDFDESKL